MSRRKQQFVIIVQIQQNMPHIVTVNHRKCNLQQPKLQPQCPNLTQAAVNSWKKQKDTWKSTFGKTKTLIKCTTQKQRFNTVGVRSKNRIPIFRRGNI